MGSAGLITLARQVVTLKATRAQQWPYFSGSKLRGAFGQALKESSCITRAPTCDQCPILRSCPYGEVFESVPIHQLTFDHPVHGSYNQRPPAILFNSAAAAKHLDNGDQVRFEVVLLSDAMRFLPIIENTWARAVPALSTPPGGLELVSVKLLPTEVLNTESQGGEGNIAEVALNFESPVRIQSRNQILRKVEDLTAQVLLMAAVQRVAQILETRFNASSGSIAFSSLTAAAKQCRLSGQLQWQDLKRYSNRQHRHIPLGGFVGPVRLTGNLAPFLPYLRICEAIHLGKETTFGLGRFKILTSLPTT